MCKHAINLTHYRSVHVRRGDQEKFKQANNVDYMRGVEYYNTREKDVKQKVWRIFLATDDQYLGVFFQYR